MTVTELIKELSKQPQDATVHSTYIGELYEIDKVLKGVGVHLEPVVFLYLRVL